MRIVILQGSPNRDGSTAILCEEFARGAAPGGTRGRAHRCGTGGCAPLYGLRGLRLRRAPVRPTRQHGRDPREDPRGRRAGPGDAALLLRHVRPAQGRNRPVLLRELRHHGAAAALRSSRLLAVAWNADSWTFDALEAHYDTLVRYLDLRDCGRVLGYGCGTPSMTRASDAPQRAFELGRSQSPLRECEA